MADPQKPTAKDPDPLQPQAPNLPTTTQQNNPPGPGDKVAQVTWGSGQGPSVTVAHGCPFLTTTSSRHSNSASDRKPELRPSYKPYSVSARRRRRSRPWGLSTRTR